MIYCLSSRGRARIGGSGVLSEAGGAICAAIVCLKSYTREFREA